MGVRRPRVLDERAGFGERIKKALDSKGISQRKLAVHLNKGSSTITGWKSGATQPSLEELAEICRLTGASADWILGLEGGTAPPKGVDFRALRRQLQKVRDAFGEIGEIAGEEEPSKER